MKKPLGIVLWRGPSRIDGAPIVAIATFKTKNEKTGNMVQTWILREDVDPVSAIRQGLDVSVCGGCPNRGDGTGKGRACYVNVANAPLAVWKAYKAGKYAPVTDFSVFSGRMVRLGAYGDPALVPVGVWLDVLSPAKGWTGYTHQWTQPWAGEYRPLLMASVESQAGMFKAWDSGWRTFRTMKTHEINHGVEAICNAEFFGTTCADCGGCDGNAGALTNRKPSGYAIHVHGTKGKVALFNAR